MSCDMVKKCWIVRLVGLILCVLLTLPLTGCASESAGAEKIAEAYIAGFEKFADQGDEYAGLGLDLQAAYAFSWGGASVSAMRYGIDCLLYMKGEGKTLEALTGGRPSDWDAIAEMNYASPYPYYFEGLVYNAEGENDYARLCYERALTNPAFSAENGEALMVLEVLPVGSLKELRKKLTALEDRIYAAYAPKRLTVPRVEFNYSDEYLRTAAKEQLARDGGGYHGALGYYEAALTVNPFEGDNFLGCALMSLYLDDISQAVYYVNEGLLVDPEHGGLAALAEKLNERDE